MRLTPRPKRVAGWYVDPQTPMVERRWDGSSWTDETRPLLDLHDAPPPLIDWSERTSTDHEPDGGVGAPSALFDDSPRTGADLPGLTTRSTWRRRALLGVSGAILIAGAATLVVGRPSPDGPAEVAGGGSPAPSVTQEDVAPIHEPEAPPDLVPTPGQGGTGDPPADHDGPPTTGAGWLSVLATLQVDGRAPLTGYDRELFGQAWSDVDRNGCDTRNDILRRDLTDVVLKPGTSGCVVLSGRLVEPYSGLEMIFERGQETSGLIQIDHVVALADAWQKGAQGWDAATREAFANDPLNLVAADGTLNQEKGAGDVATWLPPDRDIWCGYSAQVVAVKSRYSLTVTQAEATRLSEILSDCKDVTLIAR